MGVDWNKALVNATETKDRQVAVLKQIAEEIRILRVSLEWRIREGRLRNDILTDLFSTLAIRSSAEISAGDALRDP